jgi:putative transposase
VFHGPRHPNQNTLANRKAKAKLNHAYNRIVNHRKDNVEQISNHIVKNHDVIVMEDLSVRKLHLISKSRKMTKGYNDASLEILRRGICDKAESAGRTIILVDSKDTSQICSQCGTYVRKGLSVRTHVCTHCGYTADRDVNAARNILARAPHLSLRDGPAILSGVQSDEKSCT